MLMLLDPQVFDLNLASNLLARSVDVLLYASPARQGHVAAGDRTRRQCLALRRRNPRLVFHERTEDHFDVAGAQSQSIVSDTRGSSIRRFGHGRQAVAGALDRQPAHHIRCRADRCERPLYRHHPSRILARKTP